MCVVGGGGAKRLTGAGEPGVHAHARGMCRPSVRGWADLDEVGEAAAIHELHDDEEVVVVH